MVSSPGAELAYTMSMQRILLIFCLLGWGLLQAQKTPADSLPAASAASATVFLAEDSLFSVRANDQQFTARERAQIISGRLQELMEDQSEFYPDSFHLDSQAQAVALYYRQQLLLEVFPSDCRPDSVLPMARAEAYRQLISAGMVNKKASIDLQEVLIQVGLALLTLLIAGLVIRYVNRLFKYIGLRIQRLENRFAEGLKIRSYQLLDADNLIRVFVIISNILRVLMLLIIFYITLPVLLQIFPWTRGVAEILFEFILDPLKSIFRSFVAFIPNLFTIAIIAIIFHYITAVVRFFAREIRSEKLRITGFYPDWAIPTSRIINFLLYAFMLVLIWPYIPGSDSAAFQGISVFIGILISLGSSSAISNVIAGMVLTYMRPYRPGDRVKIGEVSGDIIEKNLLVTRVKTIKNEVITVPNSNILNNSSINYSQSSEAHEGLILHSSVTIGYDVPWRKVHGLLIEAASKTPMVEQNPSPFVLQTQLDDFYVSYQINAYTKNPGKQAVIYSDLHALIQDAFAKADVEIMSPHYRAERSAPSTIPKEIHPNSNENDHES